MDAWLIRCGTAGKQGGKRRKQKSTCVVSGETGRLTSINEIRLRKKCFFHKEVNLSYETKAFARKIPHPH